MSARFEIVRTDAAQPWHARFRAANGRVVWTTENYARRSSALSAIDLLASGGITLGVDGRLRIRLCDSLVLEIRQIDERTAVQGVSS